MPGTDIGEALRIVLGELPDLPYLPELPARGPGAEMIGRSAGLLVDMPVEVYAGRWRMAGRSGRDARRTADLFARDLDEVTAQASEYAGPLKLQSAGPWTLAAGLDLPIGGSLLRDAGAVRDLTSSLAEGLARHVAAVRARVPGAAPLLQLDEPNLPAVLAGRVPTESGLGVLAPVEAGVAAEALREVIQAAGVPVIVHSCAAGVPVRLLRDAGASAVSLDLALVDDLDALGEAIDAGMGLFAGAAPTGGALPSSAKIAAGVREVWHRLGFAATTMAATVVVTPACGLAATPTAQVRALLTACREAGRRLSDDSDDAR
jgi:methionine synthase II (cobalamin-independent)